MEFSNSTATFNDLRSLTLGFHSEISTEAWSSSIITLTSRARLEELHLYVSATSKKTNFNPPARISEVLENVLPLHSETLHKVSVNRLSISSSAVGRICSLCTKLESLFVMVDDSSLVNPLF